MNTIFIKIFEDITDIFEHTGDSIDKICEHLLSLTNDEVEISILDSISNSHKNICRNINEKADILNNQHRSIY